MGGCGGPGGAPSDVEAEPGAPLPGLSAAQLGAFAAGRALFDRPFAPEDGLGPLFNQDRCSSCHDLPTSGGHGAEPVLKATRWDARSGCDTLGEQGGDLIQRVVVAAARAIGWTGEEIPPDATAVAEILAPAVYGLGLVEAVPDAAIAERADPDDADGDGISGRVGAAGLAGVGRFGHKAQHATLAGFVDEAIHVEMGITTPSRPVDAGRNGRPLPAGLDPAPDPEVDDEFVATLTDYLRFLAPPARRMPDSRRDRRDVEEGERVFAYIGCDACHVPHMETDADAAPEALRDKAFPLYSDLLLHDMGPELADVCSPGTTPSEWKTARLVGLGLRSEFLHNGRAAGVEQAILLHGGEAAASRDAFRRLSAESRRQVLAFLRTL